MTEFWVFQLLGRLHPLMVHFPIALLVVAFFMETMTLGGRREGLREGIRWMILIGALTTMLSSVLGWLLANSGGYGGDTVFYHQWGGIITALLALAAVGLLRRAERVQQGPAWWHYRAVLLLCVLTLTVAGHLGASLTHGKDYLSSTLPWNQPESEAGELLATFRQADAADVSEAQLDRLNLEVRALFAHKCYKCHSTEKHEGDLVLDNREGVMAGGENGAILVAGQANESEIIRRLTLPRDHEDVMPQKGKALSREEIDLIKLWINLGAHWADRELKIFPEAPLALTQPTLPPAQSDETHPVDRWVNVYFEAKGVRWPKPVDDRTFIRRVYLDAIGLLPSPDQVEAFLEDTRADKRETLVQDLLDDDHNYAQHWLSFWNDLLRNDYSGTGYITGGRKQITDWLYTALLNNHSYDRMVHELLSPDKTSEGFIRGIQWRGVTNNSQRIEMQAAQNISQSLLGLNLKCASCHNSFVSNLTLDQAYGFATVFADTLLKVFRCDKPTGRTATPAFLYPELGTIEAPTVDQRLAQLADIMVQPANGRLYRTLTNRLWDRLLGRGLVMPVDEMDNTPWSQDLLDWLAADFLAHNTDLKHLLTRIMTSKTYQLPAVKYDQQQDLLAHAYTFQGPARRRLTAEQFADALSQILGPVYHGVAYDPFGEDITAQWIWYREVEVDRDVLPKPGKRYFRHTFTVKGDLKLARALIAVDHAFVLYVNGARVANGADWRKPQALDLREHLRTGSNVLAIEGENEGPLPNPAGVLFSLELTYADGSTARIESNTDWKATNKAPEADWIRSGFDDASWEPARRYGHFSRSHWGRLLGFRHDQANPRLPLARASLVTLNPFLKALGRPTRENVTTRRDDQATLLQALELTNGTFFNQAISEGAVHWIQAYPDDPEGFLEDLYRTALGRPPTDQEKQIARKQLGDQPTPDAVEDVLWAVLMLPEFQLY